MIVGIRGSGIAATGCAHLLRGAGLRVSHEATLRRPVPTIMLSDTALALMRDVFGRTDLFANSPRITRRVISWGGRVVTVPHDAVMLSEMDIHTEMLGALSDLDKAGYSIEAADFSVHAAPSMPNGVLHCFGERDAVAARVRLLDPACATEGRVEAVATGWLFLVPASPDEGWLLGVGGSLDALLAQSRLIAPVVDPVGGSSVPFMAAPRMLLPLCGDDWLACGTAAIGFDPICGDGTAQSVREAILASAVLLAIAEGGDRQQLLTHY
ncbi:hypothetical protein BH10PSE12_BH10PSE12_04260 [soil metagenome]